MRTWGSSGGSTGVSYKPYDMHGDLQAVVVQMCRNELAHEVMATLSFVPLLFCLFCDDPVANLPVFLITSVLAAAADLIPVILQRYNRPRLQRLPHAASKRRGANRKHDGRHFLLSVVFFVLATGHTTNQVSKNKNILSKK